MRGGPISRSRIGASPVVRWSLAALAAVVTWFHAEILVARLRDASITEPMVAVRWLLSVAALAVTGELARRGGALLRGRAGVVLAIAVLVLHAGAAPMPAGVDGRAELLAASPVGLLALGLLAATAVGLATTGTIAPPERRYRLEPETLRTASPLLRHPPLAPRPPPSAV